MSKGIVRNSGANQWIDSDIPSWLMQSISNYSFPSFEQGIRTAVETYGHNELTRDLKKLRAVLEYANGILGLGSDKKAVVDNAFGVLRRLEFEQRQNFLNTVHHEEDAFHGGGIYGDNGMIPNAEDRLFPNENLRYQADPNHASTAAMFSNDQQNFFEGPYSQASMYGNYARGNGTVGSMEDGMTEEFRDYHREMRSSGQGGHGGNMGDGMTEDYRREMRSYGQGAPNSYAPDSYVPNGQGARPRQRVDFSGIGSGIGQAAAGLGKGIGSIIQATQGGGQQNPYPNSQFIPPGATPQNYWPQQAANARTAAVNTEGMTEEYRRLVMQQQAAQRAAVARRTPTKIAPAKKKTMNYRPYLLGLGVIGAAVLLLRR